ncbi:hypothetical protein [Melissococcus plutonius]|uniref:hypothetical protein n=1 Tax=Melissococcus plutonius TaxID=33970 RepID=UPI00065E5270|nr:hypothetical protein [Melissococcus plutonius]KMT39135.1 hypothetical protein MEPL12_5c02530 [Melissococcus plutonius]
MNTNHKLHLLKDLSLLFEVLLLIVVSIFMGTHVNPFFFNLICLLVTTLLILITYFAGLVPGLTFCVIFIFGQIGYVVYNYIYNDVFYYGSLFWQIMPLLYCLCIYLVTYQIKKAENLINELQINRDRFSVLDNETNLRTIRIYTDDFAFLSNVAIKIKHPLYIVIIQISYWDSVKRLINNEQLKLLLHLITNAIEASKAEAYIVYMIDHTNPTWASLTFANENQIKVFKELVKENFEEQLLYSEALAHLNIGLVISYYKYDSEEVKDAGDFLNLGINALQYDV